MAGQCRGFDLLSMRKFVRRAGGEDALYALADRLAPSGRAGAVRDVILPNDWRPIEELDAMIVAIDDMFSAPQARGALRLGRFLCEDQLKGYQKLFMRVLRPRYLVDNGMTLWRKYHDVGTWEVRWLRANQGWARLTGMPRLSPVYCLAMCGWFERFLELCGLREVRVLHPECTLRGAAGCRYDLSWR